jgi:hypothetical protein
MAKRRVPTLEKAHKERETAGEKSSAHTHSMSESFGQGSNGGGDSPSQTGALEPPPGLSHAEFNARVARRAYDLFERRGRDEGHDVEDWLEAERLVRDELLHDTEAIVS